MTNTGQRADQYWSLVPSTTGQWREIYCVLLRAVVLCTEKKQTVGLVR